MSASASRAVSSSSAATAQPGKRFGALGVDAPHARACVRAAEDAGVEHARDVEVLGVARAAGHALGRVDAPPRPPDLGRSAVVAGRWQVVAVDDDEGLADLALELLDRLQDPRHVRFRLPAETPAATMFG